MRRYTVSLPQTLKLDKILPRTANSRTLVIPLGDRRACSSGAGWGIFICDEIPVHSSNTTRDANLAIHCYEFAFLQNKQKRAMGIAARDTICTNYTYSADCVYYLLTGQDTDCVGMQNIASSSPAETSQDEANSRTGALQKNTAF